MAGQVTSHALYVLYPLLKAAVVVAVTAALNTTFVQSLVIALVSGLLGATGMVVAAVVTSRETRRNRDRIVQIQETLGVNGEEESKK